MFSLALGAFCSIRLYHKLFFGNISLSYTKVFYDINFLKILIQVPLVILTLILGIYPNFLLQTLYSSTSLSLLY
jgi:NADH:ubiquinone oxidoreductase subunit 4 (subunit M)